MSVETHVPGLQKELQTNSVIIPYDSFSPHEEYEQGTTIVQIPPRELFTFQDWVEPEKIINVLRYKEENNPLLSIVSGYTHYHTVFEENVIVIGNGNHRALYAMEEGRKIDVVLWENPLKKEENPFRLTNVRHKYGNIF